MKSIAVNCHFDDEGRVRISELVQDGRRLPVEQGRQWRDDAGLHLLVMLPGGAVHRLSLLRDSLVWQLHPAGSGQRPAHTV